MPYAPLPDGRLYFEEHGVPDGEPLVLVHGFGGVAARWHDLLDTFAGYRVVVPDLRGHGRSGGAPDTIHHRYFAGDLVALLDHLGIERAHFVGHSSGGMCLLFIGTERAERVLTLTLVSATYTFDDHAKAHMRQLMAALPDQPEAIAEIQQVHGPFHGEDYWKVLRDAFVAFTDDPDELPFTPEGLGSLRAPVLVLHGDRDEFFPVRIPTALYGGLPDGRLCILPGVGHDLPVAAPDLFRRIVTEFLGSARVGRPAGGGSGA